MDDNDRPRQPVEQDDWAGVADPMPITRPRAQDSASDLLTSSPVSTSPHTSVDDTFDPNNTDTTDEMGQTFNIKTGARGPPSTRPDLTDVISIDQYKQLVRLITIILEGMNKSLKELWDTMGTTAINKNKTTTPQPPRIVGPTPMPATFVSVPNPYSPKHAHLYGNKPIYPEGEGPKDGNAATARDDNKENKAAASNTFAAVASNPGVDKTSSRAKPKLPRPQVFLPPGMTSEDVKAINAGNNRPKTTNAPPLANLPAGVTAGMLPLKTPETFQEAVRLYGTKTEDEIMRAQSTEMKRDSLAHFGKFRAMVAKRMDSILIRKGGREGNVVRIQLPFESQVVASSGARRGPDGSPLSSSSKSRPHLAYSSVASFSHTNGDSPNGAEGFDKMAQRLFSTHSNSLSGLSREKRGCILHCVTLILLGLENYCSYSRVLLCHLATSMSIPLHALSVDEKRIGKALAQIVERITPDELQLRRLEEGKNRFRRNHQKQQQLQDAVSSFHASANVTNNKPPTAVNGETVGGLAAPLVSAGLSTVFGGFGVGPAVATTMLQGMAESPVVVGTLFGLYGSRATTKMTESYSKDVQDFGLIPLHGQKGSRPMNDPFFVSADDRRLRLTIGITGFLDPNFPEGDDCKNPWKCLGDQNEVYSLQWETEVLLKSGAALDDVLKAPGWTEIKQDSRTVTESINTMNWPAAMIRCSKMIDNPWSVCMARAERLGLILADMILGNIGGHRPVTLIGFGAGARAIWVALMTLSEKRIFGLIEHAVLMGCPSPSNTQSWAAARSIVTGRLINVYSKKDMMMAFAMRLGNYTSGIAGLEEVIGVPGVQNYDASNIVTAHNRYRYLVGPILAKLSWEDIDAREGQKQFASLDKMMDEEKKRDELRAAVAKRVAAARIEHEQEQKSQAADAKTTTAVANRGSKQNNEKENVRPVNGQGGSSASAAKGGKVSGNGSINAGVNNETIHPYAGGLKSRKKRSGKGRNRG